MSVLIIVCAVVVAFFVLFLLLTRNKLMLSRRCEENLIAEKKSLQTKLNHRDQIFGAIANAFKSTSSESIDDFEQSMNDLALVLRTIFNSEYSAIGIQTMKNGNTFFEDFAMSYDLKDSEKDRINQQEASRKVMGVDAEDPGYFIITSLNRKKIINFFDKETIEERRKANKHFEFYEKDILKSKEIRNTTVINICNENTTGYIQFINTDVLITEEDLTPFIENLIQLIQFSIAEKENKQIKREKEQKELLLKDVEFIMNSIKEDISDVEKLFEKVMSYFVDNFGAAIVSFRIPILNGKERSVYFYLRSYHIDPEIKNQEIINQHYDSEKILNFRRLGSHRKLQCYLPDEFFIGELGDSKFCENQNTPINCKDCVILPVFKDMHPNKCFAKNDHRCNIQENPLCEHKYQNLFGIFRLRVYRSKDIHDSFYQKRLKTFSSLLNFLFDAIMDKNDSEKIKDFQNEIKRIDFKRGDEFEDLIVEILRNVTRTKVCSVYWHRNDYLGDRFQFGASTSTHRYNFEHNTVEEIKSVKNRWTIMNDGKNVLSKVFQFERSKYLYNLQDPVGLNKRYYLSVFPDFVELPPYTDVNMAFENILSESICAIPIWGKDQKIKGIVLLVGKEKNPTTISTSFWEQDRLLVELFTDVIARFVDAYEADKERGKFLHQLGHELLAPITEIVYENNSLLKRYKNDKSIGKDIAFLQLKDNMNAAMYFKHIVDDVQFDHDRGAGNKFNMELVLKPKELILGVVQLFEKKAHAEKRIAIRTNISEVPPIYMDRLRIQQVLINLLKNAIQYSHENTTIDIYYKVVDAVVDGYPSQKWHEIVVVNYGIGIPESDKDAVFGLYSRSQNAIDIRPQGTGIGLHIVKTIMRAHYGDCLIKRLNNPTEIAIYLPFNHSKNK